MREKLRQRVGRRPAPAEDRRALRLEQQVVVQVPVAGCADPQVHMMRRCIERTDQIATGYASSAGRIQADARVGGIDRVVQRDRLTALGSTVLADQLRQLSEFAQLGLRRLGQTAR